MEPKEHERMAHNVCFSLGIVRVTKSR